MTTTLIERDCMIWDDYFLGFAFHAALRSKDQSTKHGCVLVKDNKIIGTGYNSFPAGMPDSELPQTRPEKYAWMVHSEQNALYNAAGNTKNATAYVTGRCCTTCLMALHQAGISRVVMADRVGWKLDSQQAEVFDRFKELSDMVIVFRKFDIDAWLTKIARTFNA